MSYRKNNIEHFCFLGVGDCGATANTTTTTNVDKVFNNSTDLTLIKETVNKNIMNRITEDAKSCSASTAQNQLIDLKFGDIAGDFNLSGVSQTQTAKMNFSCVNMAKYENESATDLANAFTNQLETKFDTEALDKLESNAAGQAVNGFLPTASSTVNTNVNTNLNVSVNNSIKKTMRDAIANEVQKNFTTKTVNACISNLVQEQVYRQSVGNVGGNVNIKNITQEQFIDSVANCVNKNDDINRTVDKVANVLNTINTDGVKAKSTSDIKATAEGKAESKGVDSVIDSVFGGIAGIFSSMTGIIIVAVIGFVLVAAIGAYFLLKTDPETRKALTGQKKMGGGHMYSIGMDILRSPAKKSLWSL
jgi:hypothetical protein